jgi:hypothetical protein
MKKAVPAAFFIALVIAIGFAAANMNDPAPIIKEAKKQVNLKTYTAAVCEDKGTHVFCKDEFFVNCNGNVSIAAETAECEGVKIEVPSAMGAAVFELDWKDPRVSEQI